MKRKREKYFFFLKLHSFAVLFFLASVLTADTQSFMRSQRFITIKLYILLELGNSFNGFYC